MRQINNLLFYKKIVMADIEKSQAPETEFQRTNTLFTTQLSSLSYNIQQENIIKAESIAGISPLKEEIQSKRPTEQQTEKTNTEYTVQKGDTLSKIARSLGADDTTVNELIKYLKIINNKKDDNLKQ
ncbi:MAG: LysM peptidoglycan-binding domain-containing protein [Candidatus Peribacteria bacterium]|jgi:LysM repeat protein|nr:LysM peptidoglycan-binding domain-containing protein [Candidatus Peribacteria bacterium]